MLMLFIIEYFKLVPVTYVEDNSINIADIIYLIVQLIGEELFKVILLIFVMSLVYYFSKNRKLSIISSVIMTMMVFGSIHEGAYGTLLQVLLIQGVGSIFDLYAYMKTKNVFVSYIAHLLFDFIPYFIEIIMILRGW